MKLSALLPMTTGTASIIGTGHLMAPKLQRMVDENQSKLSEIANLVNKYDTPAAVTAGALLGLGTVGTAAGVNKLIKAIKKRKRKKKEENINASENFSLKGTLLSTVASIPAGAGLTAIALPKMVKRELEKGNEAAKEELIKSVLDNTNNQIGLAAGLGGGLLLGGTALGVAKALKKRKKKNKYKIVINDGANGKQVITGWDPKSIEGRE